MRAARAQLSNEGIIEGWVKDNPGLVGINGIIIGQQVTIENRGRIDLLAMDKEGSLIVVDLKRGRTPRDIIAHTLYYASWVARLTTSDVHNLCSKHNGRSLDEIYRERFSTSLPDTLNAAPPTIAPGAKVGC